MPELIWMTLAIGLAGGLGATLRWQIVKWDGALPFGLFATNILAGAVAGFALSANLPSVWMLAAVVGFAGGLSTFSTVSGEAFIFYHRGRIVQMLLTLAINVLMPVLAMLLVMQVM